ncbi:hypothetical protein KIN20_004468 [Parelaphostrongylus tenuis]|uniref:Uncharacterized protein n=1 Tax=Parelaphostrongylus tenuis TaxID=148309 RepID=A0AAD5MH18_PARTN|nr:hypothetical protein KIN20_004468 [Parelaphostrongylus tenuis]
MKNTNRRHRKKGDTSPCIFCKALERREVNKDATINPDTTEAIMKNIKRNIPFLIQV